MAAVEQPDQRAGTPHVVVVGAGFAGLTAARELDDAARDRPMRITLVDRRNHHTFQPLLYQVATSGLQPQDVGHALRPIFGLRRLGRRRGAVEVRLGEVVAVDRAARTLHLSDGSTLGYDHLVVAAGAVTNDLGLPGVTDHGYPLKSLPDALALRDHVLRRFELAATDPSSVEEGLLTFVVAGGGPTGVEMAGALAELVDHVLRRDHPWLSTERVHIMLLEAGDRLLPALAPDSSRRALDALRERGVDVRLGTAVAEAAADHVVLADGERLRTRTLVWVAGVTAAPLAEALGATTTRGGRVEVASDLTLPGDPNVRVVGDLAAATDPSGALLPQLAPVALQQGRHAAAGVVAALDGTSGPGPFRYLDKGTMATIGRNDAVAELPGGIRFGGWPAWVAWLGLHLFFLVGFRNRVAVLFSWIWNYLTYDRAARLILHVDDDHADRRPHLDTG